MTRPGRFRIDTIGQALTILDEEIADADLEGMSERRYALEAIKLFLYVYTAYRDNHGLP